MVHTSHKGQSPDITKMWTSHFLNTTLLQSSSYKQKRKSFDTRRHHCEHVLWLAAKRSHTRSAVAMQCKFWLWFRPPKLPFSWEIGVPVKKNVLLRTTQVLHLISFNDFSRVHECDREITLPYLCGGAQETPALRPQYGPNAQPWQTSWSKKSPRGFCKPQENCPMDTIQSVRWQRVIIRNRSSKQHCGSALSALGNEMN